MNRSDTITESSSPHKAVLTPRRLCRDICRIEAQLVDLRSAAPFDAATAGVLRRGLVDVRRHLLAGEDDVVAEV